MAPSVRGPFLAAHPAGCELILRNQMQAAAIALTTRESPRGLPRAEGKTALIIGSTSGYGSAFEVALLEAGFRRVIGIGYEPPPSVQSGIVYSTPGWYRTNILHQQYGHRVSTYYADAFGNWTFRKVTQDLRAWGDKIDLVLYSLAAPRREGVKQAWRSGVKPIGGLSEFSDLDYPSSRIVQRRLLPATEGDMTATQQVLGGENLSVWVGALLEAGLLEEEAVVAALSYCGPDWGPVHQIYGDGTVAHAKRDLEQTVRYLHDRLSKEVRGRGINVVNATAVTRPAAYLPGLALYLSLLLGAAEAGLGKYFSPLDTGVLFSQILYGEEKGDYDDEGRLRLDRHESAQPLQEAIQAGWLRVEPGPSPQEIGFQIFQREYQQLFGWGINDRSLHGRSLLYDRPAGLFPPLAGNVFNLMNPPAV